MPVVVIRYSPGLRDRARWAAELLQRHGIHVVLEEVNGCQYCHWEIRLPNGIVTDPYDAILFLGR